MESGQPSSQEMPADKPVAQPGMNQLPIEAGAKPVPSGPANSAEVRVGEPPPVSTLNADEQMALFAKELKENDWGHQPC